MRISIFQKNNHTTYKEEYSKIIKVLNSKCITYDKKNYTYFDFINTYLFHHWKYRETFLSCTEYLNFIGVDINHKKINEESFINFIEFLLNIQLLLESMKKQNDTVKFSQESYSILFHNIPLILERYGYQAYDLDDKVLIYKNTLEYEELLNIVPDDIYELLLSYNHIDNNGIRMKRIILNKIYNYIEKDIDKYKSYNNSIYQSIKLVIMKMGVIGNIDKKYLKLTNYKLKKYYDYCFHMMCYLIQSEEIYKYKEEIKNI